MDGKGIILHLREVEGDAAILDTQRLLKETGATSAEEVNVLEESLSVHTTPGPFKPYETRFIRLTFDQ